ncbi:MAG: DUF222 domain-containing protein [Burkholderiales bacterium]|nr:DUF222 domain-containing protein [Burkholderiales bacterium]
MPLPELEARITELAGHLNAAHHRFLALVAEFDRREGWADGATRSCAHWLGWKCGIELGAAREKVRTGRALESLPRIAEAMSRGELSYSKVRALTRVATPQTEETLLMIAQHGTAHHVESVVRGYRRAQQAVELDREARQQLNRGLTYRHDEDGSLWLQGCLPAEGGAIVLRALQRALDEDAQGAAVGKAVSGVPAGTWSGVPAGTGGLAGPATAKTEPASESPTDPAADPAAAPAAAPESADTPSQRRADALVRFAESWLARGDRALAGGERQTLVVHIDAGSLVADRPGRSGLEDGPVLAVETVRRLGCDASLVAIVEDGQGRVLDVGRRTRSIPAAIGRALRARDRGCRYPGCTQQRFVEGHHIEHWAHGGGTRLSNLVLLCRRHHRKVHEGGVRVQRLDDGALRFVDGLGRRIDAAPPQSGAPDWIAAQHRQSGPPIDAGTATGHWRGERLDLGLAVAGLCVAQAADTARRGAARDGSRDSARDFAQRGSRHPPSAQGVG